MFACANKNNSQANILCFYFCQSHALKRLDFTKINLSSLKIPRKRKDNLKISGSFHPSISSPRVPTQHGNIPFHKSLL
jgi:hypothetical protein